jgi:hypothetical protein
VQEYLKRKESPGNLQRFEATLVEIHCYQQSLSEVFSEFSNIHSCDKSWQFRATVGWILSQGYYLEQVEVTEISCRLIHDSHQLARYFGWKTITEAIPEVNHPEVLKSSHEAIMKFYFDEPPPTRSIMLSKLHDLSSNLAEGTVLEYLNWMAKNVPIQCKDLNKFQTLCDVYTLFFGDKVDISLLEHDGISHLGQIVVSELESGIVLSCSF